jgi:hypothetical protein
VIQPTVIARVPTWPAEEVRVEFRPYRGQVYVHVRRWHRQDGDAWTPGAGLAVGVRHLPALRRALETAEESAREIGALR